MKCNFYVGQKVVCVDACVWRGLDGVPFDGPQKGEIVTISAISAGNFNFGDSDTVGISFHEWNPSPPSKLAWFHAVHFKPLDEARDRTTAEVEKLKRLVNETASGKVRELVQ